MMRICSVATVMVLATGTLLGSPAFDPAHLEVVPSKYYILNKKNRPEYFNDYLYQNKVVFRALEALAPAMDCLILQAMSMGRDIELEDPTIINFCTRKSLRQNLSISPPLLDDILLKPDAVKLYVENRDGVQTKFIIKIEPVSDEFVISAKMYAALAKAKVSAVVNGKLLSLNLSAIDREEVDPQYCISLVDDPDKEEAKKVNKELSTIEDEATDYLIERDSAKHHRALHLKKHHRPIE